MHGAFTSPDTLNMVMNKYTAQSIELRRVWMEVSREHESIRDGGTPMLDYIKRSITVILPLPEEMEGDGTE